MSTINDSDLLLVERGGSLYKVPHERLPELNDTDLLLVERSGTLYKCEFSNNGSIADSDLLLVERSGTNYKIAKSGLVFFQGPIGYIEFFYSSNLGNGTMAGRQTRNYFYSAQWGNDLWPYVGEVTKGGTDYVVAMPTQGAGYFQEGAKNLFMCNFGSYPSLDYWTPHNGAYDPLISGSGRNSQHDFVVSKPHNAMTVWRQGAGSSSGREIYRDYNSTPGEYPPTGLWPLVSGISEPQYQRFTGTLSLYDDDHFNMRYGIRNYASSETSTIAIPYLPHANTKIGYTHIYRPPITLSVALRTTNGYDYALTSHNTSDLFPNKKIVLHYNEDSDYWEEFYYYPTDIAYGNGVWVITRGNHAVTNNTRIGGTDGTPDSKNAIIYSNNDGITWNRLTSFLSSHQLGVVSFGEGNFIATPGDASTDGNNWFRSTDGANWTAFVPQGLPQINRVRALEYGNGMWVLTSGYDANGNYYSYDNGVSWQKYTLDASQTVAYVTGRYIESMKSFFGPVRSYNSDNNQTLAQFYRFQ